MPNNPEYYFQKGLDYKNKTDAFRGDPYWEDVHCEIYAAKFFEKSAQMGYTKAMKAIYI